MGVNIIHSSLDGHNLNKTSNAELVYHKARQNHLLHPCVLTGLVGNYNKYNIEFLPLSAFHCHFL